MREVALLVAAVVALLMAACGLLLWQWARKRQSRQSVDRHLDLQLHASAAASAPASDAAPANRGAASADYMSAGLMADPWYQSEATSQSAPSRSWLERAMPGWLLGVVEPRTVALALGAVVVLSLAVALFAGLIAGLGTLALLLLGTAFAAWLRIQKMRRKLVHQLPGYIDAMVRLITIGNSTQAAFQLAIASTQEPLRGHLERSASLVRAGVDLDRALHQTASNVRIEEMYLLASILGLGVRYGGRSDLLLERVSNFMRDREQAEHELAAMSAETRLSAWILGMLPIGVGAFMISNNPNYFLGMWYDGTGRVMVLVAVGLQLLGGVLLYRLARIA